MFKVTERGVEEVFGENELSVEDLMFIQEMFEECQNSSRPSDFEGGGSCEI